MNSILKIFGLVACLLGCVFTNTVWVETPIIGGVKGLSTGSGMIVFGCLIIGAILFFMSLFVMEKWIYWFLMFVSIIPMIAGFYYYQNIQSTIEKISQLNNIYIFGMSVEDITKNITIEWKNGFGLTMFMSGVSLFFSLLLLLLEDSSGEEKRVVRNQHIQSKPLQNYDNHYYIEKLKELFELHKNGVISTEIYEEEKSKIFEQQKSGIENPVQSEFKRKVIPTNTNYSTSKKTLDPNLIFVLVAATLLIGGGVFYFSKKNNNAVQHVNNTKKVDTVEEKTVKTEVAPKLKKEELPTEIKIEEFTFGQLEKNYGLELATETTSFSLKDGNPNKLIYVAVERCFLKINGKYEAFNQKKHEFVGEDGFKSEYSNKKYKVFVVGGCKEKPNAQLEGEMDCSGTITVEDKKSGVSKTINYVDSAY